MMPKRLIVISNRLPLTVEQTDLGYTTRPSSGGLVSAVNAYLNSGGSDTFSEKIWLGMPGCSEVVWDSLGDLASEGSSEQASQQASGYSAYKYLPVFVEDDIYDQYYNGFSNSVLWPLFHYFPSYAEYNPEYFEAYIKANQEFCRVLSQNIRPDDVVWIHDYHLLPLAGMLRAQFPDLTIGLFLHIPFPSFELFRLIPKKWQKEILTGMMGADLIGFHTAEYVQHFLKTAEKALGVDRDGQVLEWHDRRVKVDAFPISIEFNLFNEALNIPEVQALRANYLEIKGDKKMIFSVDRLDYTKGIYNRLEAYEKFLTDNPEYKGKIVFVLVVVPSRDTISKYNENKKNIDEYIGNINSTLGDIGWQPVIYQYCHLDFPDLLALYTACDLALITPLRDGMNLVAKEFITSRSDLKGVLILSEMAGAAAELGEAILINPNDMNEIAEAIKEGLEMPDEEQQYRMEKMRNRIQRYDVKAWALDYFSELDLVQSKKMKLTVKFMDSFMKSQLLNDFAEARKRLILVDYDGTLVPIVKEPHLAVPNEELLKILSQVSLLDNTELYVISGRDGETLGQWLGGLHIGLVAEHGAKVREFNSEWKSQVTIEPAGWRDQINKLMERFVAKCPNSFIETKEYSIAWHYRKADSFLASTKAGELFEELLALTFGLPLDVIHGKKVIEVRNSGVNKGKAIERKLEKSDYDFILCIGDDRTDEDMFAVLAPLPQAYTIKVGYQASAAKYNVHTPYLAVELLEAIGEYTKA